MMQIKGNVRWIIIALFIIVSIAAPILAIKIMKNRLEKWRSEDRKMVYEIIERSRI